MIKPDYREEEPWMLPLMQSYYDGVAWPSAVATHDISNQLHKAAQHGPYSIGKVITKERCQRCDGQVTAYFASRKERKEGCTWARSASCISCGHKPFNISCNCDECKRERQKLQKLQKEEDCQRKAMEKVAMEAEVQEHVQLHNSQCTPIEETYGYEEWAILLAMLEQSTSEDPWCITPLANSTTPFSPDQSTSIELIQKVLEHLLFADACPYSASVCEKNLQWNGLSETYRLRGKTSNPKKYLLDQLRMCAIGCGDAEVITLDIGQLMLNEALVFLKKTRNECRLPHKVGDKTRLVLKHLILHRPLGEILFLIWKACNDAAASVQKGIPRPHATNLIIGNMERMHVRARNEDWKLSCYKRFSFEDQNWISYVYFNLVLQLPGQGLEYSWLDVMKKQELHISAPSYGGPLASCEPEAFEALSALVDQAEIPQQ